MIGNALRSMYMCLKEQELYNDAKESRWNMLDLLLFFTIIFREFGTWNDRLPVALFEILVGCMGLVILRNCYVKGQLMEIPWRFLMIYFYMSMITIAFGPDIEAVKDFVYFGLQMGVLCIYVIQTKNHWRILNVIFFSAMTLAIYGLIQEIGYLLSLPMLYDPTRWGFFRFYATEIGGGLIALYSLYDEPSHLASVLCAGLLIGMYKLTRQREHQVKNGLSVLVILSAIALTASTTVFIGFVIAFVAWLILLENSRIRKVSVCGVIIVMVLIASALLPGARDSIVYRLQALPKSWDQYLDPTTFAISSNVRVTLAKLSDGYILGTGFDSNRIYYKKYVDLIYGSELQIYMNYGDAASMFTRILSEFGIAGIGFLLFFIINKLIDAIRKNDPIMIIMIVTLVVQCLRSGDYSSVLFCLPLAYMLYAVRKKEIL